MRNKIIYVALIIALVVGLSVFQHNKKEEHDGLSVGMMVTSSRVFNEIYGYNLTGKIRKFVYKKPGEETSLVAVVQGEDVPIYLLRKKD